MMTHSNHESRITRTVRDESGVALLIAVIVLLLMSALGLAALQHSGDEASGSGRSRRKDATLYAAESGLALFRFQARDHIRQGDNTFVLPIDEPDMVKDPQGNPIHIRSGIPSNGTLPATALGLRVKEAATQNVDGYALTGAGSPDFKPLRADITAMSEGNGLVHLIAQFRVYEGSGGKAGY